MSSTFCVIDDKHVPLYRIVWISAVPHFCGAEDCEVEGRYEIRLEQGESVWSNREERDNALSALEVWQNGPDVEDGEGPWE
jgi:hypothetical protein